MDTLDMMSLHTLHMKLLLVKNKPNKLILYKEFFFNLLKPLQST